MFFAQTLPPAHEYILYTNLPNLATFAMRKEPTNGSAWLQSDAAIDLLLPPHPRLAGEASRLFAVIFVTADFNIRHCEKRLPFFVATWQSPERVPLYFNRALQQIYFCPLIHRLRRHLLPEGEGFCEDKSNLSTSTLSRINSNNSKYFEHGKKNTTIYSDDGDWCREPQLANECDRNVLSVRDLARLST